MVLKRTLHILGRCGFKSVVKIVVLKRTLHFFDQSGCKSVVYSVVLKRTLHFFTQSGFKRVVKTVVLKHTFLKQSGCKTVHLTQRAMPFDAQGLRGLAIC